ncbi:MAG: T9SS type A sorting domain-containing protein [Flavobacteriales bacterium]
MMKTLRFFTKSTLLVLAVALVSSASAQRNCGSMQYLQQQIGADPSRAAVLQMIDQHAEWFATTGQAKVIVTIPVVFHVVYANATQNISDAKIQAQVAQLNADYARLNSDAGSTPAAFASLGANTQIQFCLAQRDPSGAASTGIERRSTTVASFTDNDNVKFTSSGGMNAWPSGSYMNFWSANLGGGLLGYAQFPGGSSSTDGVVCLYSSIGSISTPGTASPYNLGRTATHEVGHWLNLRHIWGDANCGSDLVSDTPTQQTSNGGCPSFPHTTCSNGANGDMFMNYMDYTDDACMNIFTQGQSTRMNALFGSGGSRVSLLSSQGCVPPSGGTCGTPSGLSASSVTTSSATLGWSAVAGATSYNLQHKLGTSSTWTTVSVASTSYALGTLASNTTYNYQVQAVCSSGSSAYSTASSFTTLATGGCTDALEPNNSTAASATITLPASINALIASGTDADYYRFTLASTSNVTLNMSNLAGDYDLRLLNSTGTQLAISQAGGTTAEAITYNSAAAGTYYVHAFGYGGAFSATQCYLLTASAAAVGCTDAYESNNTSGTAKTITKNADIPALISSTTDVDWFKFSNTSSNPKIKINLSNLAGDYDVTLYRGTSTQVGISQNGGTTAEQIILNTTTVATYYVKVVGYNGAFSASQCYTLRASTQSANWREIDEQEVTMDKIQSGMLNLWPNPTSDKLNIEYLSDNGAAVRITVIDELGREIFTMQQPTTIGTNVFGVNMPELMNGMYMLRIVDGDHTGIQRFMFQR